MCEEYGLQRVIRRLGHIAGSDTLWAEMYFHPQSNITDRSVESRVKADILLSVCVDAAS